MGHRHALALKTVILAPPLGRTNDGVLQPCTCNSADVTVVDLCPECASNQIDLSQEAFAVIANGDAGRINIEYNR
ncbi:EG45-like domain containing protein [Tanacetum coccineum]